MVWYVIRPDITKHSLTVISGNVNVFQFVKARKVVKISFTKPQNNLFEFSFAAQRKPILIASQPVKSNSTFL